MFNLNRTTASMSKRAVLFTMLAAGIILAPVAFESGALARGGNGGNGGGSGGGNGGHDHTLSSPDLVEASITARRPNERPGQDGRPHRGHRDNCSNMSSQGNAYEGQPFKCSDSRS